MSLLDDESMPHECTIRKRVKEKVSGGYAEIKSTEHIVSSGVKCWEQSASYMEVKEYEQRGMSITTKMYFNTKPNVAPRHEIVITKRQGTAVPVADQEVFDVVAIEGPDSTAGLGLAYKVMCKRNTSSDR